jgi:hypothetical protein
MSHEKLRRRLSLTIGLLAGVALFVASFLSIYYFSSPYLALAITIPLLCASGVTLFASICLYVRPQRYDEVSGMYFDEDA